jgi:hypothetical protein
MNLRFGRKVLGQIFATARKLCHPSVFTNETFIRELGDKINSTDN